MTADMQTSIRASRRRVARSRGALSGILLVILGLWAALVPFIGPYFNLAFTPSPNSAWHWTAARGWLEVLPGAAAFVGGLLLLASASRAMTIFGGWLAALAGAWLIIGPSLAGPMNLNLGRPDPSLGSNTRALAELLFFYAIGAAILFVASVALGRVSVLSVRDVRAAERRAEAEEAERQATLEAAVRNAEVERDRERAAREADGRDGPAGQPAPEYVGGAPHAPQHASRQQAMPGEYTGSQQAPQPPSGPGGQYPPAPPAPSEPVNQPLNRPRE